jgi:hypothetical protein
MNFSNRVTKVPPSIRDGKENIAGCKNTGIAVQQGLFRARPVDDFPVGCQWIGANCVNQLDYPPEGQNSQSGGLSVTQYICHRFKVTDVL